jgi:hypothetical protein
MATIAATKDIKSDANELANIAIEHKIYTRTSRKYYQMSHMEVKGSLEDTLEHNLAVSDISGINIMSVKLEYYISTEPYRHYSILY